MDWITCSCPGAMMVSTKPENGLHLWDVKPNIGLGSLRGMLFGIKIYIYMLSRVLIKVSIHIFGIFEYSYVSLNHLYATEANEKLSSLSSRVVDDKHYFPGKISIILKYDLIITSNQC